MQKEEKQVVSVVYDQGRRNVFASATGYTTHLFVYMSEAATKLVLTSKIAYLSFIELDYSGGILI